jgi:hypothetical protein
MRMMEAAAAAEAARVDGGGTVVCNILTRLKLLLPIVMQKRNSDMPPTQQHSSLLAFPHVYVYVYVSYLLFLSRITLFLVHLDDTTMHPIQSFSFSCVCG